VLGAGTWGLNHLRVFSGLPGCTLVAAADPSAEARARVAAEHPGLRVVASPATLMGDPGIDAVVIATPSPTHAAIATQALKAGHHVLVEKPLALSSGEARGLAGLARSRRRVLMVDHLLEYHPGFERVLALVRAGRLGHVLYAYAQRLNLGVIRKTENALWSLASHDVSMLLALFSAMPLAVSARGGAYVQRRRHDVVFVDLLFPGGRLAHLHVSWLDPHKTRRLTVVGDRRMAVFDDMAVAEKVRVYEKRASPKADYRSYGESIAVHSGEVWIPRLPATEPLRLACAHFVSCIRTGRAPRTGAAIGLKVVRVLEAAQRALDTGETVRVR
jgi:predicted dehydrogenase